MRLDLRFLKVNLVLKLWVVYLLDIQSEALGGTAIIPQALFHNQIWD